MNDKPAYQPWRHSLFWGYLIVLFTLAWGIYWVVLS